MYSSTSDMEKAMGLEPDFLRDLLGPRAVAAEHWPSGDSEIVDGIIIKLEEGSTIQTSKLIKNRGWLQRLLDGLNQVDSEQAMESAHRAYSDYCESLDIVLVDEAFKHYMEASRDMRRSQWELLRGCTSAALVRYWRNGKTQQDLKRLVHIGNEAIELWTETMEPLDFGVKVAYVTAKANKALYTQSVKKEGLDERKGEEELFELASKCFTKVIDSDRVGNLNRFARMELGLLIVRRCRHKNVAQGLNIAIPHLEGALKQVNQLEETPSTRMDALRITSHLTLAYYSLYIGQVKNTLTFPFSRSGRLRSLDSALDYLVRTQTLLEQRKITTIAPARLHVMFGTLFVLRWLETGEQSDAQEANEVLETARAAEGINEGLKLGVDKLLSKIGTSRVVTG